MIRSTRLKTDLGPPMTSDKAALGLSQHLSLLTARKDAKDRVSILAWEATIIEERATTRAEVGTAVHK